MRNAGLDEAQAGIKIVGRNINNLRYADDTTLMAESKEEPKSLLMNVKRGEWKSWLKSQHSKNENHGSSPITSWQIDGETMETVRDFIFLCSKITVDGDCSHELKYTFFLEEKLWPASVQFSSSVVSNSLQPHELPHPRPPCPSPTPGVHPNPCPLSRWCQLNHLIPCCPLLLMPSIFPSIRVFSNESALCIR